VCHGDAAIGRRRDGGGDAGDLLKGHAGPGQRLQLLSAPAEDEGVAPLQPHHAVARLGLLQQDLVDPVLGDRVAGRLLAHVDLPGRPGDQIQYGGAHQPVVDHHVRRRQGRPALHGEQSRIPGTRPNQRHFS